MFGPNKVPKSLVDAVSQIMQVDEAAEKVPTPTGMKVYGSSYGNSAKARRDQTKSHVDTIKGPKEKDLKEEDLDEEGNCVTKPEAKDIAKKEVHHHNKTMHKGQKDTTKNEEVEEDKGVMSFKDRLLERAMTDAETKKKEKMVLSMKDKQSYFKKKYGKRWKEVMYATATKKAMSEEMVEEENLDEAKPEELERQRLGIKTPKDLAKYSDVIKKRIAATPASHWKQVKKAAHDDWKKAMGEEVELDESYEHIKVHSKDGKHIGTITHGLYQSVAYAHPTTKFGQHKDGHPDEDSKELKGHHDTQAGIDFIHAHHRMMSESMVAEDIATETNKDTHKTTTDMLRGRVEGGKLNSFKNFKVNLVTSGEEDIPKTIEKGEDTREKQKITTNPGPVDIKFDDKLGSPTPQDHFSSERQITHEEVQIDEKTIAGTPGWEKVKGADDKGNVKDKSGAVHTPMSRARDLARTAMKRIKTEMLGKAPGNN